MRIPYKKSSHDNLASRFNQGIGNLVETAGVPRTWTNFNTADPGVTLFEQLCFVLTDLEYRLAHPVKDILSQFQQYRKKLNELEGVLYCWFKPIHDPDKQTEDDHYDGPSLCQHSIHVLLEKDVDESQISDILDSVKKAISTVDFIDTNEIYLVGNQGLHARRSTETQSLPYFSAQEIYSAYPVSEQDFRRLVIDIVGVNNAWFHEMPNRPGLYHIIVDPSNESLRPAADEDEPELETGGRPKRKSAPRQRLEKRIRDRLVNFRPLGIEFGEITWVKESPLNLEMTIDIGNKQIEDLDEFGDEFVRSVADFISPRAIFTTLDQLNSEERMSALSGPALSSGFLTHNALVACSAKENINVALLKKTLLEQFGDQLDFIKRVAIGTPEQGMVVDSLLVDTNSFSPRLKNYRIKICRAGEMVDTLQSEFSAEYAPVRCNREEATEHDGEDCQIGLYQGVHTTLPEVFQTGLLSQDSVGGKEQKSDAAQLRTYLSFFDYVLYSLHQQLANIAEPFNLYQYLPSVRDGVNPNILASISGVDCIKQGDDELNTVSRLSPEERERLFVLYADNDKEHAEKIGASIPQENSTHTGIPTSIVDRWFSRILKTEHDRLDRYLRFMGVETESLGYGNSIPIAAQQRLYQIKRDLLTLCYHSPGFYSSVNGIPASQSFPIDHMAKRLQLLLETIYLQNNLSYQEGDRFFYLVDHIHQFGYQDKNAKRLIASPELSLDTHVQRENGLSCFLPADPGAIYLSGLEFEGIGQGYNEEFQWPMGSATTIEMMVFVPPGVPGVQTLFNVGGLGGHNRFQVHLTDADGWMHFDYGNGGNRASVNFQPYFNRWVHLAVSVDSAEEGKMCIHLDSKLVKQEKRFGHPLQSLTGFQLGHWQIDEQTRYGFFGRIAEVRIWSAQQTNEQLQEGIGKVLERGTPNLELYWPLTKGNYLDFSGNGYTLTLTDNVDFPDDPPKRVDFDEEEEDEFISVYDQFATRVISELPAHLNLKLYCLSDRLYQWVAKYFENCTDVKEDYVNKVKYLLVFFERHCAKKEIITEDRLGDLAVFSRIMGWVESFSEDPLVHVSLDEEPDYANGNKTALVTVHFNGTLAMWCKHQIRHPMPHSEHTESQHYVNELEHWESYINDDSIRSEIQVMRVKTADEVEDLDPNQITKLSYRLHMKGKQQSVMPEEQYDP